MYEYDLNTGNEVHVGFSYSTTYYSPRDAVSTFIVSGQVLPYQGIGIALKKRSVSLEDLDGLTTTQSTQTLSPIAEFEQYLEIFYAIQTAIADTIRPVLNNITSQTNSTLIHQMADSIFYDLTRSTTVL